jgi:uncharacterized protein (TIGR01777 family)
MSTKLIIAGGSGSIGSHIINHLKSSFEDIVILSRGKTAQKEGYRIVHWDAETSGEWAEELNGAEALINLTGKSIQCRFTEENKRILWDSRINSTSVLGEAISKSTRPPEVWINASGASIYPETFDIGCTEEVKETGTGFLAELSIAWEEAMHMHACPNTRKVIARITPVLDDKEGFLPPLKQLSKLGLGGQAGNGKQVISWIHHQDIARAFAMLIERKELAGVFNLGSPDPRSNKEFMRALRKTVGVGIGLPAPGFAIKMSSALIGIDASLILDSSFVLPARLQEAGFTFDFANLESALENLL